MKADYVNINVPVALRDEIKSLAKRVPRRSMISFIEMMVAKEAVIAAKEDKLKSEDIQND